MQVSVENSQNLERKITITLPSEQLHNTVNKKLQQLKGQVRLPGFRVGKVRAEALESIINDTYGKALEQENITPASSPTITDIRDDKDSLSYDAVVEVYPEIADVDYAALNLDRAVVEVGESDIDDMIMRLREQRKRYEAVVREANDGDNLTIDYVGKIDGEEFKGGKQEGARLILGSKTMIEGFEEALIGMKAGEVKDAHVSFPKEYHAEEVAGKDAVFTLTVKEVAEPVLPEVDAEFIKEFGVDDGTEAAFREQIAKNLRKEVVGYQRHYLKNQVGDLLDKQFEALEIPKALLDQEKQGIIKNLQQNAPQAAVLDSLMDSEELTGEATRRVRIGLVITDVIKKAKIGVSPEDIDAFLDEESSAYEEPEQFKNYYRHNQEAMESLYPLLVEQKAIEHIANEAGASEKTMSFKELVEAVNQR
jgi:trigger factor